VILCERRGQAAIVAVAKLGHRFFGGEGRRILADNGAAILTLNGFGSTMQTIDLDASMLALVHLAEHSTGAALSQLAWDRGRKADSSIAIFDEMGGSTPRTRFLWPQPRAPHHGSQRVP